MTAKEQELLAMYSILPMQEQNLAYELIKRLVLAWDSDFTKLTPAERARLDESERDWQEGRTVKASEIDWN
ncbi:MAG: hypothetical protein J6M62_08870 [Selenomonadaceae bacterium]|nr:hypothetical protein [Selenomonadaceae bacterium]MBO6305170.1 hypothetical protein [Selenomonadaceae bacterium]